MASSSTTNNELVKKIIRAWTGFVASDETFKVGKTLHELLEMAAGFCKEGEWAMAQYCCERGSETLKMDSEHEKPVTWVLGNGALNFMLATTYVGWNKIDRALDYYKKSSQLFSTPMANMPAAAVWYCVGEIYSSRADWVNAMSAFQRSLSVLDAYSSKSHTAADQYRETAQSRFSHAKMELEKTIRNLPSSKRTGKHQGAPQAAKPDVISVPIIRDIAAGSPKSTIDEVLAANLYDENIVDTFSIDCSHLAGAELGFRVSGKSMIEGGIFEGDYALIRMAEAANNGEIVVAVIRSDGTESAPALKKYYHIADPRFPHDRLQPMNSAEQQILVIPPGVDPKSVEAQYQGKSIKTEIGEVAIKGKLVAIWRKTL